MSVFLYHVYPGKALRMLVDIARLAERFNRYSIYQFTYCFTLQTSDYGVIFDFCVDLASLATLFKKCNVIMT